MPVNYLGIDYGAKRVGLAVGSSEGRLSSPLDTLVNDAGLLARVQKVLAAEQIDAIVLGLPRGLDGQDTQQTIAVRKFAARLNELGLPVYLQDEALTSELARQQTGRVSRHSGRVDQVAAALILQDYLNQL